MSICGWLVRALTPEGYATYLDLSVPETEPNYSVRPTDTLPAIRKWQKGIECALLKWGFPYRESKVLFNAGVVQIGSFCRSSRVRLERILTPASLGGLTPFLQVGHSPPPWLGGLAPPTGAWPCSSSSIRA